MSKKQDNITNANATADLFRNSIVPLMKKSIELSGGLENFLLTHPHLASRIKETSQNQTTITWLSKNSPFNSTEINNSFNKLIHIHEEQQLSGETITTNDSSESD